jgi:hypothetical protein
MPNNYFDKFYRERLKDAFMKSRGQVFAQFSSREKLIYVILIAIGCASIRWRMGLCVI